MQITDETRENAARALEQARHVVQALQASLASVAPAAAAAGRDLATSLRQVREQPPSPEAARCDDTGEPWTP